MNFYTLFFTVIVALFSVVAIANEKSNLANSYYTEALELLNQKPGDYLTRAHEKLLLAAENDHPRASTMLYINYYNGSGTEKNLAFARKWLLHGAELGDSEALHYLAHEYDTWNYVMRPDNEKAMEYFKKAADSGHSEAQRELALFYYYGKKIKKNNQLAASWMDKAARGNDADANYRMGLWHKRGQVYPQDIEIANQWFARSIPLFENLAKRGNRYAQRRLGSMYNFGNGTPRNDAKALEYLLPLAKANDASTQHMVSSIYYSGESNVPRDIASSKYWLKKSANNGHKPAQDALKRLGW